MKRLAFILLTTALMLLPTSAMVFAGVESPSTAPAVQQTNDPDYVALYDQVSPSVVFIEVLGRSDATSPFVPGGQFQALGSGFVYDTQGHIVTNYHVVGEATRISVTFQDGTFARAEVVGLDPNADLAVIRVDVDPSRLRPVTLATSDTLEIGEPVAAIGNPFGQTWTMTTGIVSGLGRVSSSLTGFSNPDLIQTDAAINPGNSGGPLFDAEGRVIGVNTLIFSETESNSGVGFAVPADTVARVVPELIENGTYPYTWLGISGGSINLDIIELLGLDPNTRGVLISGVVNNGPAEAAGLRDNNRQEEIDGVVYGVGGDIITAINGTPITGIDGLISYLAANTRPGDVVTVTVIRDGQVVDISVTLQQRPNQTQ